MSVKVYVISEPLAVDLLVNNDIDGFKELLDSDKTLYFPEPKIFDTEEKALAFCADLGYGKDKCAGLTATRSGEPAYTPFIEAFENY